jgi:ubiquinone biosynthesis protein COQ4
MDRLQTKPTSRMPLPSFDVVRAGRALGALLEDPDDLPQVFTIIDALSGTAPHRLLRAFTRSTTGARLLHDQPDITRRLCDRDWLRALPPESLGRAYLAFVESEGISPEGIRDASIDGAPDRAMVAKFEYVLSRMRDTHDLWHTVTGYQGDVLGELALLSFNLAQHWNTAIALIVLAGIVKGRKVMSKIDLKLIFDGYRRGRAAAWLPAQEWETLLALPLTEVRVRLALGAPAAYTPVRSNELRSLGVFS